MEDALDRAPQTSHSLTGSSAIDWMTSKVWPFAAAVFVDRHNLETRDDDRGMRKGCGDARLALIGAAARCNGLAGSPRPARAAPPFGLERTLGDPGEQPTPAPTPTSGPPRISGSRARPQGPDDPPAAGPDRQPARDPTCTEAQLNAISAPPRVEVGTSPTTSLHQRARRPATFPRRSAARSTTSSRARASRLGSESSSRRCRCAYRPRWTTSSCRRSCCSRPRPAPDRLRARHRPQRPSETAQAALGRRRRHRRSPASRSPSTGQVGNPPNGFIRLPTSCSTHTVGFDATSYDDQTATGSSDLHDDELRRAAVHARAQRNGQAGQRGRAGRRDAPTIAQTIDEAGLSDARSFCPTTSAQRRGARQHLSRRGVPGGHLPREHDRRQRRRRLAAASPAAERPSGAGRPEAAGLPRPRPRPARPAGAEAEGQDRALPGRPQPGHLRRAARHPDLPTSRSPSPAGRRARPRRPRTLCKDSPPSSSTAPSSPTPGATANVQPARSDAAGARRRWRRRRRGRRTAAGRGHQGEARPVKLGGPRAGELQLKVNDAARRSCAAPS